MAPGPREPLHLEPLTDLVPAASLVWLVEIHPRALFEDIRLAHEVAQLLPEARLSAFVRSSGGIDPRRAESILVASYPQAMLWLVHEFVDPARVEGAFKQRVVSLDGRATEGLAGDPRTTITRLWGSDAKGREQLALFGVEAVGLEQGKFAPLRASELFAEGRLKRASPALRTEPLMRLDAVLGDAPVRAFAPGPFQDSLGHAVGGLLGASTAVGATARVVDDPAGVGVAVRITLLGAWGSEGEAAGERLRAVYDIAARSGLGRLLGLGHCLAGPQVQPENEALTLRFTVKLAELAAGLYAATAADAAEIVAP
jgi:hypothetical protein